MEGTSEEEQMALAMRESLATYQREHEGGASDSQSEFHMDFSENQTYQFPTGDEDADLARALTESMQGIDDGQGHAFEPQTYERHREVADIYRPSDRTKRELRLVFLGMTGAGKSSSANTIIGREEFTADCHGSSITSYCKHANAQVQGRDVVVVDTPGLFDTRQGNDDTMREITRCVCLSAPGPHALILVVQGGNRQTDQVQKCADIIMDVFGDQARRYLIILFTHRDDIEYHGQTIHGFVQTLPPKMKQVLSKCGNRYMAFNNRVATPAERDTQVKELFAMVDNVVSQNGGRCFTNDVYKDFEQMIVARERKLQEKLDRQKAEELTRIQQAVEKETQRRMKAVGDQRDEELTRERQLRLEAEMNAKMNEKLLDLEQRYANRYGNLRGEVRTEVQSDEQGTGELLVNGVAKFAEGFGKGVGTVARGVGKVAGGLWSGLKSIFR